MLKLFRNHKALFAVVMVMSTASAALTIAAAVILENILNAVTSGNWELFTTMIGVVAAYIVVLLAVAVCGALVEKKLIAASYPATPRTTEKPTPPTTFRRSPTI